MDPVRSKAGVALVAAAFVASACAGNSPQVGEGSPLPSADASARLTTTAPPTTTAPTTTTTEATTTTTIAPEQVILDQMSEDDKIGQLLMPVVYGTAPEVSSSTRFDSPLEVVTEYDVGGVVYLGHNITGADQLTALSVGLQDAAMADTGIPLLVAVDQEGGRVVRVHDRVTAMPSARSFEGDAAAVEAAATVSAQELRTQGINVILAPVADVTESTTNVIGDRSYSGDPNVVADMVVASVVGHRRGGAASAVKHWPGHGSTEVDSHHSLPTIELDVDAWAAHDRAPFDAAIGADAEIIMVGHLAFPAIDPTGQPATISDPLINGLLRGDLGFEGVVMSDALDMGAVADWTAGDLAVIAVAAGVDLLLAPADVAEARDGIRAGLADGRLTPAQLDDAVRRILRLKIELGLLDAETYAPPADVTQAEPGENPVAEPGQTPAAEPSSTADTGP